MGTRTYCEDDSYPTNRKRPRREHTEESSRLRLQRRENQQPIQ